MNAPWAPPGAHTLCLNVGAGQFTQPIFLRLDPRVCTPPAELARLAALTREMYDGARVARGAHADARASIARLEAAGGEGVDAFKRQVESIALAPPIGGGRGGKDGGGRWAGAQPTPPTLDAASAALLAAAMGMQGADVAPTDIQIAACELSRSRASVANTRWSALKTAGLAALNAKRKSAGLPPIVGHD